MNESVKDDALRKMSELLLIAEKGIMCWNIGHCKELPRQSMWCPACLYSHKKNLKRYKKIKDYLAVRKALGEL